MANSSKFQEMECSHNPCSCCQGKEDKSMPSEIGDPNRLKTTLQMLEHRFCNLTHRRQYLIEKIVTIEKTMPLLMASAFSSSPDEAKSYLENLLTLNEAKQEDPGSEDDKIPTDCLNEQVDKLYEEIIETEVEYEEAITSFENLLAINRELEAQLSDLRGGKKIYPEIDKFNDLYKIIWQDDEDDDNVIICLKKLKAFVQQEINLKKCINVLERREKCLEKLILNNEEMNAGGFPMCGGKICRRRKKEMPGSQDDEEDDEEEIDVSKYCDCCPRSKKG